MDFVRGATIAQRKEASGNYELADIEAAAAAVLQLTNVRMHADTALGPVGGVRIGHDIIVDCLSALPCVRDGRRSRNPYKQSMFPVRDCFRFLELTFAWSGGDLGTPPIPSPRRFPKRIHEWPGSLSIRSQRFQFHCRR